MRSHRSSIVTLILLLYFALCSAMSFAGQKGHLVDYQIDYLELNSLMLFLHDKDSLLEPDEVLNADGFRYLSNDDLLQGFNAGTFWLQIRFNNPSQEILHFWIELGTPRIDRVEMHQQIDGQWKQWVTGTKVPMQNKPIDSARPILPIDLMPGENHFLLSLQSNTAISLESHLWRPEVFRANEGKAHLKTVLVIGGMLLASVLSLIAFSVLRESPYLFLGMTQLSAIPLEMARTGLMQQFLWPVSLPFWSQIISISGAITLIFLTFFVRSFLDLNQRYPRLNQFFLGLLFPIVGAALISIWHYASGIRLLSNLVLILFPMNLILTLFIWYEGHRVARYLTFTFVLFWIFETLRQLANNGIFPWSFAMNFSILTTLLLTSPILLFGLVERTRNLSEELQSNRQLSKAKAEFFAQASHELRAPLNTIIGYARMLKQGSPRLPVKLGGHDIEQSGLRLLEMINQLMMQSGLDSGGVKLQKNVTDFNLWWHSLIRASDLECQQAGNSFSFELLGDYPSRLRMDDYRLRQVLDNLIANANKHTKQSHVSLKCQCQILPEQDVILNFKVCDSGGGIDSDDLAHILDPFVQLNPHTGGLGLGLSIIRDMLHLMDTRLLVTSRIGEGSEFEFTVLVENVNQIYATDVSALNKKYHGQILIVDDSEEDRLQLNDILSRLGFETITVTNASEAVAVLIKVTMGQLCLDALITDQQMAGGDGWYLLSRSRIYLPTLPVILTSSLPPNRPMNIPEVLDFDVCLRKPVSLDQMCTVFSALLDTSENCIKDNNHIFREPSVDVLLCLAKLSSEGEVTLLDEELASLSSDFPEFVNQLREMLYRLDFIGIESICNQAVGRISDEDNDKKCH